MHLFRVEQRERLPDRSVIGGKQHEHLAAQLNTEILFVFSVREFLPKEYTKTKGVEKRIFQVSYLKQLIRFDLTFSGA